MSTFSVNTPGRFSNVNLDIKNKMNELDKDPQTQLYGGRLHYPTQMDGLLDVATPSSNKTSLLYTRNCHPKNSDIFSNNPYTYDLSCLQNIDKDLGELINEIDNNNLDIHSKDIVETIDQRVIFDTSVIDSVKGNFDDTMLSFNFMSRVNSDVIQDTIQTLVYKELFKKLGKSINIGTQSYEQLYIVMRSILLQHGDMTITNKSRMIDHIKHLNKLVVDYCVNNIVDSVLNYNKYIYDKSVLPIPQKLPENTQYQDILTDDDAKNYLNMEIDPLSYYPGFGNNEMNLKTSIVDYNKYE